MGFYSVNVVVFGQGGCIRAKVVVFGQKLLYKVKVVVLVQNGGFRARVIVFGQKWL